MKHRYNDIVSVQYQKCCSDREEVRDFVNKIRDENPNIVFFRKDEISDPTSDESVLVTIQGWFDYCDSNSKPKKKKSKEKI